MERENEIYIGMSQEGELSPLVEMMLSWLRVNV